VVLHRVRWAREAEGGGDGRGVENGLLLLVGFARRDGPATVGRLARRIARLRVFPTDGSMLGQSALDAGAAVMVASQMPLAAATDRGTRPNLSAGAPPAVAADLYDHLGNELVAAGVRRVVTLPFASSAELEVRHWGPFTLCLDA
jgi:D-tyrosyl-tRNA(Tyr) deacylase